jgi:hypothetical protein
MGLHLKAVFPKHPFYVLFIQVALLDMLWSFAHTSISKKFGGPSEIVLTVLFFQCETMVCLSINKQFISNRKRAQSDLNLLALWP